MDDEFSDWLKEAIDFNKKWLYNDKGDDIQIKLLEQVLKKYEQLKADKNVNDVRNAAQVGK